MIPPVNSIRIAYALVCYDAENSGVFRKVIDQVTAWRSLGHSVRLYVVTDEKSKHLFLKVDSTCITLVDDTNISKVLNRSRLLLLASQDSPSLIYLRDNFPMRIPKIKIPIIVEIQSLVGRELKIRSKTRFVIFSLTKRLHYKRISGAVFVSEELMKKNEFRLPSHTPRIAIGNSINLNRIEVLPPRPDVKPSLLFLGTPNQAWQGISELIEFARENSDIQIDVVGESLDANEKNIIFHGYLSPDKYRTIAANCVAGIGTLNLSAKGMTEASPLKVREYLALGLPVILKYRDTDLELPAEYVLRLPSDGRRFIDFSSEIRSFVNSWSRRRVSRTQVRNIDIYVKERVRLEFFKSVITKSGRSETREI